MADLRTRVGFAVALDGLRRAHVHCSWREAQRCDCGALEWNAKLDAICAALPVLLDGERAASVRAGVDVGVVADLCRANAEAMRKFMSASPSAREAEQKPKLIGNPYCEDYCPSEFSGRWRDWHRGSGCSLDDGEPRTAEGAAEIAALGVDHAPGNRSGRDRL